MINVKMMLLSHFIFFGKGRRNKNSVPKINDSEQFVENEICGRYEFFFLGFSESTITLLFQSGDFFKSFLLDEVKNHLT